MLVEAGYNVGLMTTVAYGVNDNITSQTEHMTTVLRAPVAAAFGGVSTA